MSIPKNIPDGFGWAEAEDDDSYPNEEVMTPTGPVPNLANPDVAAEIGFVPKF